MADYHTSEKPDAYQICLNGHPITNHYHDLPDSRRKYCLECGAETTHTCLKCHAEIPGGHQYYRRPVTSQARPGRGPSGTWDFTSLGPVPPYCEECGGAFPWTERAKAVATPSDPTPLESLERLCQNFHLVALQLRDRSRDRPPLLMEDEYDVQYLLGALLPIFFRDVRTEEWTPSYAGGASRMDFLLKGVELVVEVKRSRPSLSARELRNELIVDAACYRTHPDCKTLVCLVYDPEDQIANPEALMADLSGQRDGLDVRVWVVPRR
jgi:hypothetical protein